MGLFQSIWETYIDMAPYLVLGLLFAGILHIFFKKSFIEKHLGNHSLGAILKASFLGVPLPLCSCGVVPTALSLKEHNASDGAVVSFLISTPQTGVDSIAATYGMMGPFFAIFRPFAAFVMGIFGGLLTLITGDRNRAGDVIPEKKETTAKVKSEVKKESETFLSNLKKLFTYGFGEFLDGIATYIVVGIVISGIITFFLPDNFFEQHIGNQWTEMALMVLGGVPLYICSTGSIPIALSLMMKGLSPGAAFVFLAVGPATNAATITVIRSKLGNRVTVVYLLSMIVSSMFAGWLLNTLPLGELISEDLLHKHGHHHGSESLLDIFLFIISLMFLIPLTISLYKNHLATPFMKWRNKSKSSSASKTYVIPVEGMSCQNCARHVTQAALSVEGVVNAEVDLDRKCVTITGEEHREELTEIIQKEGYIVPQDDLTA